MRRSLLRLFLAALTAQLGRAEERQRLAIEDVHLLIEAGVSDGQIALLATRRCLGFPLNHETASALSAGGASIALLGKLAAAPCTATAPSGAQPGASTCPPAYRVSNGTRGCIAATRRSPSKAAARGQCTISIIVDGTVDILLQGDLLVYETVAGTAPRIVSAACIDSFPTLPLTVTVRKTQGRGRVHIAGQPSSANGYLVRVRLEDPLPADNLYRVSVTWPIEREP